MFSKNKSQTHAVSSIENKKDRIDNPPEPWWKSFPVIFTCITALGIILFPYLMNLSSPRVNHFLVDDYSSSAQGMQAQRKEHCQTSLQNYKEGDYHNRIVFADQPEILLEKKITNILMLGKCSDDIYANTTVGGYDGTSIILTLEYLLDLIQSHRLKGRLEPVVVTISLHEAEPGEGLPAMDQEGLLKVKSLIESIVQEKSAIAIIGPSGKLQRDLQKQLKGIPHVDLCTENNVADCVNNAFKTARSIASQSK